MRTSDERQEREKCPRGHHCILGLAFSVIHHKHGKPQTHRLAVFNPTSQRKIYDSCISSPVVTRIKWVSFPLLSTSPVHPFCMSALNSIAILQ